MKHHLFKRRNLSIIIALSCLALAWGWSAMAASTCYDCYEWQELETLVTNTHCCTVGSVNSQVGCIGLTLMASNQRSCNTSFDQNTQSSTCESGDPCGAGSGGGGGGGGLEGGDDCIYGPADPFCPVSCSSCTWDPHLY